MIKIDEAMLARWKEKLEEEADEIYHCENWKPHHAKVMKDLLEAIKEIMEISKMGHNDSEKMTIK